MSSYLQTNRRDVLQEKKQTMRHRAQADSNMQIEIA